MNNTQEKILSILSGVCGETLGEDELDLDLFENDLLAVSASCENLIQELYNWSWEKDRANTPEKGNDHCIDALRYVLNSNYVLANKILLQSVRMRKEVAV